MLEGTWLVRRRQSNGVVSLLVDTGVLASAAPGCVGIAFSVDLVSSLIVVADEAEMYGAIWVDSRYWLSGEPKK